MGNFYVNHTVRSGDAAAVAAVLRAAGRTAWVAPPIDGQVVVYDQGSDTQNPKEWRSVARSLSRELGAPCLVAVNHDDDVLIYELYEDGQLTEEFSSNPGFSGSRATPESSGSPSRLCSVWGAQGASVAVADLLRRRFTFAVDLHAELAKAIGLPDHSVGTGFKYVEQDEIPPPLTAAELQKVP